MAVTWNPSYKSASVILSNGDLTATGFKPSPGYVRATTGKGSGKWYFEIVDNSNSDRLCFGFAADGSITTYNTSTFHRSMDARYGYMWYNGGGVDVSGLGGSGIGAVYGFALDLDADTFEVYKNGVSLDINANFSLGNSISGRSGLDIYPCAIIINEGAGTLTVTANFGGSSFAYSPPAGYAGWDPSGFTKFLLQDDSGIYDIVADSKNFVDSGPITQSIFDSYGFGTIGDITNNVILSLGANPKLLINYEGSTPSLNVTKIGGQIRYLASFDNKTTWKAYTGGTWNTVDASNIGTQGMTKSELDAVTQGQWDEIYALGTLHFLVELHSHDSTVTPTVDNIAVGLPAGAGRTDVKYAFSNDSRISWKVYDGGWVPLGPLTNLSTNGMSKAEVEAITSAQWKSLIWDSNGTDTLDVAIELISHDNTVVPSLDAISLTYDQIPLERVGDDITVPTPANNLTRFVWNGSTGAYELKSVEGLMFYDGVSEYYSTNLGLILKYLDIPLLYSGQSSSATSIELENTFDVDATDILLTADVSGLPVGSSITFSTVADPFEDLASLSIASLASGTSTVFYIKLSSTLGTVGSGSFDIRVKGTVPVTPS